MKMIILLSLAPLVVCTDELYSKDSDKIDIEGVLSTNTTLKGFNDCFVDKGECSFIEYDFKKDLPDIFATTCSKCTTAKKYILRRFFEEMQSRFPVEFEKFRFKYDPTGKSYDELLTVVIDL